jgi:hypothetical protein
MNVDVVSPFFDRRFCSCCPSPQASPPSFRTTPLSLPWRRRSRTVRSLRFVCLLRAVPAYSVDDSCLVVICMQTFSSVSPNTALATRFGDVLSLLLLSPLPAVSDADIRAAILNHVLASVTYSSGALVSCWPFLCLRVPLSPLSDCMHHGCISWLSGLLWTRQLFLLDRLLRRVAWFAFC